MKQTGNYIKSLVLMVLTCILSSCQESKEQQQYAKMGKQETEMVLESNLISYKGTPSNAYDRSSFVFSDQGAWFAYGLADSSNSNIGFTGPFLMTQENGVWLSSGFTQLKFIGNDGNEIPELLNGKLEQNSFSSHLKQTLENDLLRIEQTLFFSTGNSAIISNKITNKSNENIILNPSFKGEVLAEGIKLYEFGNAVEIQSDKSFAKGYVLIHSEECSTLIVEEQSYSFVMETVELEPNETKEYIISNTFVFRKNGWNKEMQILKTISKNYQSLLDERINEKRSQIETLKGKLDEKWRTYEYEILLAKTILTLQNNWRIPAGELKHSGIFPSYHYVWFNGFWAWDSWKHAAALAHFNLPLAKDQVRAMYDFMEPNGFIPDCIYRDTTIEAHNYRNTKAPLSAWAVWEIYSEDGDTAFLKEMYPQIKLQHEWWYKNRDHDQDGLCEYGSTDGTVIAGKWESGMDNAVRFDNSEVLQNGEGAYSLDQESVDLNAYLFAEKRFLKNMADVLNIEEDANQFTEQAKELKTQIQASFFDVETAWFYDISIDGSEFIKAQGCEGWIALWANCATKEQAESIRTTMMDESKFNTKVPLPTLTADHPKFKPDGGYWRGPNWLDQCYFGVVALHNYGFHEDAYALSEKLMQNAEGVLDKGIAIRENYNPITGAGLESYNFSWSAAHYLLLLINE